MRKQLPGRSTEQIELLLKSKDLWQLQARLKQQFPGAKRYFGQSRLTNFKAHLHVRKPLMDAINLALLCFGPVEVVTLHGRKAKCLLLEFQLSSTGTIQKSVPEKRALSTKRAWSNPSAARSITCELRMARMMDRPSGMKICDLFTVTLTFYFASLNNSLIVACLRLNLEHQVFRTNHEPN